jgi:riboflavin-specific deaminase-like protein
MTIRALFPEPAADVDLLQAYAAQDRSRHDERPWVMLNMVSSVDGASAVDGRAGGLSGATDQRVLSTLRLLADVVLVGAGTVRAEGYAPHQPSPEMRAMREAKGQTPAAAFAIPTSSLDLNPSASLFVKAEPASRTILFVPKSINPDHRSTFEKVADVVTAGEATVDLGQILTVLGRRGARVVLCEGGPILNGLLLAEGLIDELCVTISPLLVGGPAARIIHGALSPPSPVEMRLASTLEADDGVLFLRYVRRDIALDRPQDETRNDASPQPPRQSPA